MNSVYTWLNPKRSFLVAGINLKEPPFKHSICRPQSLSYVRMFIFWLWQIKSFMVKLFLIQNSTFMFSSFTCIPTGKQCRKIKIIISIIFFRLLMLCWAHFGMEQTLWFCVICTENALEMDIFVTYKNNTTALE